MSLFRLGPTQAFGVKGLLFLLKKGGGIENVENDRGITLIGVVGKLLNIIMFILRLLQV